MTPEQDFETRLDKWMPFVEERTQTDSLPKLGLKIVLTPQPQITRFVDIWMNTRPDPLPKRPAHTRLRLQQAEKQFLDAIRSWILTLVERDENRLPEITLRFVPETLGAKHSHFLIMDVTAPNACLCKPHELKTTKDLLRCQQTLLRSKHKNTREPKHILLRSR